MAGPGGAWSSQHRGGVPGIRCPSAPPGPVRGDSRFSLRDFAARRWGVTDVPYRAGPIKPLSARGCRVVTRKRKTKTFLA